MASQPERSEAAIVSQAIRLGWSIAKLAEVLRFYRRHEYSQSDVPAHPTDAAAGTEEKIRVMQARVRAGKAPHHWGDPYHASGERTHLEADRQQNGRDVHRREARDSWDDDSEDTDVDYDAAPRRYFHLEESTHEADTTEHRQNYAG